jgi:DNA-binding transcriptional LysR family regulator
MDIFVYSDIDIRLIGALEQLRVFVAVAERQHVTQAAQALNLAQSAASHAIAALEAEHGTKLFSRIGRGIVLTEAGRAFLDEARAVLAQAERVELVLSEFGSLKRGTLLVQASQTIAGYWLPRHLANFRRAHPDIDIRLAIGNTAQVAATVDNGATELGLVEGAVDNPHLASSPVARDQLVVVVAPEHPWANKRALKAKDLAQGKWVLREKGSGTRSVFEDTLGKEGLSLDERNIVLELPSNEAVRGAVEAGLGATALSASVAAPSIEAGLLKQVRFPLPAREFHVLWHRERYMSRAAEALLTLMGVKRAAKGKDRC